ncbi:ras-related protein Rab-37 isoform X2 [Phlebotomus papatasi]|uniref:ras-related protein Rab-37 isoform X2 n=1 Tax=Phlebotomus papatasi TaxID=29031 RepID=UPI002483F93D|nr:ras-related protein Rab-37 isoform X2 [Phlebotomus papatasi]XP_055707787.1 ras-related protein Rab-37 isoform X2 [Phlebotomus papatasi]XP_055707788.1 ras-related protein Rab-37 isoform X2 [Phlebotomus papatasi]
MITDDSLSDEVFEDEATGRYKINKNSNLNVEDEDFRTPSPSGYPGYKPPAEALRMYGIENGVQENDDWKSYKIEDDDNTKEFDENLTHKTILLGDSGVGKTSLLVQYNFGEFRAGAFSATVGIALTNKIVTVDQVRVKLQIWDTAGQERFRSVTHAYYRDAHALLLLYDVTNKVTFDNTRAWLVEIREYAQEDVVIMLLGNKADCGAEREVKKEEGERLAREYNVGFLETSAKTGLNVDLAFLAVARQLKSRKSEFAAADDAKFNVQEYVREHAQRPTCPNCI